MEEIIEFLENSIKDDELHDIYQHWLENQEQSLESLFEQSKVYRMFYSIPQRSLCRSHAKALQAAQKLARS